MTTRRRANPVAAKAGASRSSSRRYGTGGKLKGNCYKCGGKIKK